MFDANVLINIGGLLVGIGSVYGLIRADLKTLHKTNEQQRETNKALFNKYDIVDRRINDHIEHHHMRVK